MNISDLCRQIIDAQDNFTIAWHEDLNRECEDVRIIKLVIDQHKQNFNLWHEEDKAREPDAENDSIATVKRNIDALNQRRNDMITEIDVYLSENDLSDYQNEALPWNSETLGSIIDRLSIASLKIYHMHEQTIRTDAAKEHVASCSQKLMQLNEQRNDLVTALNVFLNDIVDGRKQNKLYRQFKMYNDPSLNPKIYSKK